MDKPNGYALRGSQVIDDRSKLQAIQMTPIGEQPQGMFSRSGYAEPPVPHFQRFQGGSRM